jgi:hypothetical protein
MVQHATLLLLLLLLLMLLTSSWESCRQSNPCVARARQREEESQRQHWE